MEKKLYVAILYPDVYMGTSKALGNQQKAGGTLLLTSIPSMGEY